MRRALPFVLLAAVLAALGIGAAASSGDNETSKRSSSAAPAAATAQPVSARPGSRLGHGYGAGHGHGHGMLRMLAAQVLASGAQRLDVTPAQLRRAARTTAKAAIARRFDAAGLSEADRANLKACRRAFLRRSRGGCDRAAARASLRRLHDSAVEDLASEKDLIAADLAKALGKPVGEVLTAARAELVKRVDQGVAFGLLTTKGRDLALGCFDAPDACDVDALHDQLRFKHRRRP